MQLEVIGVGGAGCRLADAIRAGAPTDRSLLADVFVFDTDAATVQRTVVPESHRHQYGKGTGLEAGVDLERALEIGPTAVDELLEVVSRGDPAAADAFLVAVGLGGVTGGGTAPALVSALQQRYDAPVYVLATLPADREFHPGADASGTGPRPGTARDDAGEPARPNAATNAIRTLDRLDGLANAVVLFDNEAWLRPGETIADARKRCNRELATRVAAVFGSVEPVGSSARNVVDASDLERILGNESAIVTLGYGDQVVETESSRFGLGLLSTEREVDDTEAIRAVETVVRKGIHGKRTLECEPERAARGLVIVGGPPAWLDRQAVAEGRRTLQSIVDGDGVLGGDAPRPDAETVFAAVALADVDAARLDELRAAADRAGSASPL